jgi:predicted dehydrogenase
MKPFSVTNKDIQGVVVATPDHWHALLTIMACAAGKDVYVEKPMTLFLDEGKWMIQAARKYNRIVTVGTQRRQGKGVAAAKKVVESGVLGKIHSVRMASFRNIYPGFGKTPVEDPPPGFDYDMWLGPGAQEAVHEAPRPLPFPLVLGLFGRPDDQSGRAHHRPGAVAHEREGSDDGDVDGRPLRARRRRRDAGFAGRARGSSPASP